MTRHSPDIHPHTFTLQPGLLACYTTAADIGAAGVGRSFEGNAQFIHFNCQLAGTFRGQLGQRPVELAAGELSCGHAAGERFHVQHCPHLQNIEVMVTADVLSTLAGDTAQPLLESHTPTRVFLHHTRSTRATLRAAQRLARLVTQTPHAHLRLHAATLEFLHWQLSAFYPHSERPSPNPHEYHLLLTARERLLQNLAQPPTIAELAHTIGMNQCRLKQLFKVQFGAPIYATFQRERMARARELLRQHNVTETAGLLGYSNISHFSVAFANQFGYLPSQARRYD